MGLFLTERSDLVSKGEGDCLCCFFFLSINTPSLKHTQFLIT